MTQRQRPVVKGEQVPSVVPVMEYRLRVSTGDGSLVLLANVAGRDTSTVVLEITPEGALKRIRGIFPAAAFRLDPMGRILDASDGGSGS